MYYYQLLASCCIRWTLQIGCDLDIWSQNNVEAHLSPDVYLHHGGKDDVTNQIEYDKSRLCLILAPAVSVNLLGSVLSEVFET